MTIFSFHPVKQITTGEGGAVLTNDARLYQRLLDLRTHGITKDPTRLIRHDGPWYYEQQALGFNYRITDLQCALGLSQMRRLPAIVARRRALVSWYQELLADLADQIDLLVERPSRSSAYHLLVAQLSGGAEQRRHVFDCLHAAGIRAQVHYIPVHLQPWYRARYGYSPGDLRRAERYYAGCISLPLYPSLTAPDLERVTGALRRALSHCCPTG